VPRYYAVFASSLSPHAPFRHAIFDTRRHAMMRGAQRCHGADAQRHATPRHRCRDTPCRCRHARHYYAIAIFDYKKKKKILLLRHHAPDVQDIFAAPCCLPAMSPSPIRFSCAALSLMIFLLMRSGASAAIIAPLIPLDLRRRRLHATLTLSFTDFFDVFFTRCR
jgi:hypothetical protein